MPITNRRKVKTIMEENKTKKYDVDNLQSQKE